MSWFKGRATRREDSTEATEAKLPAVHENHSLEPLRLTGPNPLDAIGEQNELIRVRISQMADRLDEIKTLTDDFALLADPLDGFLGEYPRVQTKLFETEALLARERASTAALRREIDDLGNNFARAADELSVARTQVRNYESLVQEHDEAFEELRLTARERATRVEALERQLVAESERVRALSEENKELRTEVEGFDQTVNRLRRDLAESRDLNGLLEHENRRLQQSAEEQTARVAALDSRCVDLEQRAETERQTAAELEARLVSEQVARQKGDAQREVERSAHQTEIANLSIRIEALTSRLSTTEKILSNARDQLAEKIEAWRLAERSLKEAVMERNALERRLEAAQDEIARQSAQLQEIERARNELMDRCDMFTKALAAKETLVENANGKAAILSNRVEQLIRRFEQERADQEAANRRLQEELENEKAERLLAQGALNIARESRSKLQKQYAALKRGSRDTGGDGAGSTEDFAPEPPPENNVRRFQPAMKVE